jgi:hypothetical protein
MTACVVGCQHGIDGDKNELKLGESSIFRRAVAAGTLSFLVAAEKYSSSVCVETNAS